MGRDSDCSFEACPCHEGLPISDHLDELEPRRATPPGPTSEAVEAVVIERQDVPRHFRETSPEGVATREAFGVALDLTATEAVGVALDLTATEALRRLAEYKLAPEDVLTAEAQEQGFYDPPKHKPRGLAGDSATRKDAPVYEGFLCYFPNAIAECARLSKFGNDKHNAGQPLHWSFNKSNDHGNCIGRHQLQAEEIDPETGDAEFLHAVMVAWRGMAQLETLLLKRHPELKPGKNVKGFER